MYFLMEGTLEIFFERKYDITQIKDKVVRVLQHDK